jgi:hypothetical protein
MTFGLLAILTTPVTLNGWQHLLLLCPLCLGISIVYKTLKCEKLGDVPLASVVLWVTMVVSMFALGFGIWLLFQFMAP